MKEHKIRATFKGQEFEVVIDGLGVYVCPVVNGEPEVNEGHSVWIDPNNLDNGELLVHAYHSQSDEPVSLSLTADNVTVK